MWRGDAARDQLAGGEGLGGFLRRTLRLSGSWRSRHGLAQLRAATASQGSGGAAPRSMPNKADKSLPSNVPCASGAPSQASRQPAGSDPAAPHGAAGTATPARRPAARQRHTALPRHACTSTPHPDNCQLKPSCRGRGNNPLPWRVNDFHHRLGTSGPAAPRSAKPPCRCIP